MRKLASNANHPQSTTKKVDVKHVQTQHSTKTVGALHVHETVKNVRKIVAPNVNRHLLLMVISASAPQDLLLIPHKTSANANKVSTWMETSVLLVKTTVTHVIEILVLIADNLIL